MDRARVRTTRSVRVRRARERRWRWQVVGFCPKLRRGLVWWIWQQRRRRLRLRGEVEESAKRRMRWLRLVMGRGLKLQRRPRD